MAEQGSRHKMRVRMKSGVAEVKVLLQHPMETGTRKDPATGLKVPRSFIRELICEHNGHRVLAAQWSWGVARNPYLSFRIREAAVGDRVRLQWTDDGGATESLERVVVER